MCVAGADGYYKEINPTFRKTFGYSKKELLSTPLISFIHPEDLEKTNSETEKLFLEITSIHFENRMLKKMGTLLLSMGIQYKSIKRSYLWNRKKCYQNKDNTR